MMNYLGEVLGDLYEGGKNMLMSGAEAIGMGTPAPRETLEQAQSRMAGTTGMDPRRKAELDRRAQAAGFPNYEVMVIRQNAPRGGTAGATSQIREAAGNAMAWHPKETIGRAAEALRAANRR